MKRLSQPTRSFFTSKISWKTSPGWLQLVFHFGTENRADQLKKPPCIIHILNMDHPVVSIENALQLCKVGRFLTIQRTSGYPIPNENLNFAEVVLDSVPASSPTTEVRQRQTNDVQWSTKECHLRRKAQSCMLTNIFILIFRAVIFLSQKDFYQHWTKTEP